MHSVAFAVKRAHLRTVHHLQRCVKRFGLTPARYDMMVAIAMRVAPLQRDLWRLFDVSRTTVSRMLRALEELGLVCRHRQPGRPSCSVNLTSKGRLALDRARWGCERPVVLLFESLYATLRGRLARAKQVVALGTTIAAFARGFGDRARDIHLPPDERYGPFDPEYP